MRAPQDLQAGSVIGAAGLALAAPAPAPCVPPPPDLPPAAPASTGLPVPVAAMTAWQRLSANRGVQRALALGKLSADCLDLLGTCLTFPITGTALMKVVARNFKADWHQCVHGTAAPDAAAPAPSRQASGLALVSQLSQRLAELNGNEGLRPRKLQQLQRVSWTRGIVFAASLFAIGASGAMVVANPVIGGLALVLSVYAARQAYANWRLARENLSGFRAGGSASPMGANALGHVLHQEYLQDTRLSPAQALTRASHRATAVGAVSLCATAAVGGASVAAGVALPAGLSATRHVIRGIGSIAAPVTEVVGASTTEAAAAAMARERRFDARCGEAWRAFLADDPRRAAQYREALAFYTIEQLSLLPGPPPSLVDLGDGRPLDIGPLVRWTRETRRLHDLPAWWAREAASPAGPTWAAQVLADLQATGGSRSRGRALMTAGAAVATSLTIASLSA